MSEDADRLDALSPFRQTGESLIHRCARSLKCPFPEWAVRWSAQSRAHANTHSAICAITDSLI